MRDNDLNNPGAAGKPDGWGWLMGYIVPTVVPPLVGWIVHKVDKREKERKKQHTKIQVDQSTTQVDLSKIQVDQSKIQVEQSKTQVDQSKTQVDQSKTQVDQSKTQLDECKTQLDQSKTQLDKTLEELQQTKTQVNQLQKELKEHQHEAYRQKERDICVKEEYLSRLKDQLRKRQDMKCSDWNPIKTQSHRQLFIEQQMLGEAEADIHARGLGVPSGLHKIFKYDNYCGPRPEEHGYLMWKEWRKWKGVVDKEREKLSSEKLDQGSR
uniref:Uncharacterized protein n=1 Tax=Branchiostoma floridae TaxID=7739 RepID=C3ZCF1_BRAFL|eukprot:XP_002593770.1 hypothetical protein BRAFLDRAFT_104340 [Branchiostoma floridae]